MSPHRLLHAETRTVRPGLPTIRAAAFLRITVPRCTDASIRRRCTYTLMRVAFRATRTPQPETTPPELMGGAVEGTGAVLVAAGGGRTPSPESR
jgi:hypothetical protein